MTELDVSIFKKRLSDLKADLLKVEAESEEGRQPVELDQTKVGRLSRMDALQGQAMALAIEERRKVEIQRINAALIRIENDDYGYCISCDEEIAIKRLELDPAAPTCISCAEK